MYNFLRQGFENVPTVTGPNGEIILNLSKRELDRIEPVPSNVNVLILDHNYIRRLENLANVYDLQQLSLAGNKLLQMHGVANLTHLTILNLPNNGIVAIDGLIKLIRLRWLNLSGNRLKVIDQLDGNINLKHLDLSDNCITQLNDISHLRKLTTLLLHGNRISSLETAPRYLPNSLEIFSLASNAVMSIQQVQHLRFLQNLDQFSIQNNPCTNCVPREFEPQVLAALPSLRMLDGSPVVRSTAPNGRFFGMMPPVHPAPVDQDQLRTETAYQQPPTLLPPQPQRLDSINSPNPAIQQPYAQPLSVPQVDEAYAGRYVAGLAQSAPPGTVGAPAVSSPAVPNPPVRGLYASEASAPSNSPGQSDSRPQTGNVRPSVQTPVIQPTNKAATVGENAHPPSTAIPFDDLPVASLWALTSAGATLSSRDSHLSRPADEPLLHPKPNGYPDTGPFAAPNTHALGPIHVPDDELFIQSTSTRAAAAQSQVNGHLGPGRDQSTASSLLMSESVYLPVANASLSPDQSPLGPDSVMSRSTPLCALGSTTTQDPIRSPRSNAIADSLDFTTASQELESSRATIRLSDQLRIPGDTLQSSYSLIPMNRPPERPRSASMTNPVVLTSPSDISNRAEIDGKLVVQPNHNLIDSVHLLNDEEEEDRENERTNAVNTTGGGVGVGGDTIRPNEFPTESEPTKARVDDLPESGLVVAAPERGVVLNEHDSAESIDSLETGLERRQSTPMATMVLAGSRVSRNLMDLSNSLNEPSRGGPVQRAYATDLKSKSLESTWFRVSDLDPGPGFGLSIENSAVATYQLGCSTTHPGSYRIQPMISTNSMIKPVSLSRLLPRTDILNHSPTAITPTPVKDRPEEHCATDVDAPGGLDSGRIGSDSQLSAACSRTASDAPCTACGLQSRVLRDHIVFLRAQLQAQFKAAEAEARMRQLHSNAIEFLLKEVQELKAWKESVCRSSSVTPLPSNNPNSWLDTNQSIAVTSQPHTSNETAPTSTTNPSLRESSAPQLPRSNTSISARGDTSQWSGIPAGQHGASISGKLAEESQTASRPPEACFDSTTQLFTRIEPGTCHPRSTGPQAEIVKVYASDEEEVEEPGRCVTRSPSTRPVLDNSSRSNSVVHLPDRNEKCPDQKAIGSSVDSTVVQSDSGCVPTEDEALFEMELVRQAALHAMNLSSSQSDGEEEETPRQLGLVTTTGAEQTATLVHEEPTGTIPVDRTT